MFLARLRRGDHAKPRPHLAPARRVKFPDREFAPRQRASFIAIESCELLCVIRQDDRQLLGALDRRRMHRLFEVLG